MNILEYIPVGRDKAVTREQLVAATGLEDRIIRDAIAHARHKIAILNMQDGKGYFIPDTNVEEERDLLQRYVSQETNRAKTIFWSLAGARKMLKSCAMKGTNDA